MLLPLWETPWSTRLYARTQSNWLLLGLALAFVRGKPSQPSDSETIWPVWLALAGHHLKINESINSHQNKLKSKIRLKLIVFKSNFNRHPAVLLIALDVVTLFGLKSLLSLILRQECVLVRGLKWLKTSSRCLVSTLFRFRASQFSYPPLTWFRLSLT